MRAWPREWRRGRGCMLRGSRQVRSASAVAASLKINAGYYYMLPGTETRPVTNKSYEHMISVADPGCLSRIPDPKTATKDKGEKICCLTFL
jgi:hypothetical protein